MLKKLKAKKFPPYGSIQIERQKFKNPPWMLFVCAGANSWQSAKARNQRGDSVAMVLPAGENPHGFTWPVSGCMCVIEWNQGPSVSQIVELARALLRAGAESVTIWPRWVDYPKPHLEWSSDKPLIKTYRVNCSQEAALVRTA